MMEKTTIILALSLGMFFFSSCVKQKATVTVHYEITNLSGLDLKINSSYRDFFLSPSSKETFTDVQEGIEYYGACNFENVFAGGFSLTVTYKGEEHTLADAQRYSNLENFRSYSIKKLAPREYSVSYSFPVYEIYSCLAIMGVELEGEYYEYGYYPE